jgi:short-chain fatty acids transporter
MVVMMIVGFIASFINWAFSTVVCPILAMRMCKKVKGLHFPMMVAAGYSTMILGQCMGPSASVYALLAGEGHFLEDVIGVLPQSMTTYNPMNVVLWFILAIVTVLLSVFTTPPASEIVEFHANIADEDIVVEKGEKTPAEAMNNARILTLLVAVIGLIYIFYSFATKGVLASLSLNFVIFVFITLNCLVYKSPKEFIAAIRGSMTLATDVMIQFPFYGAIMQMMQDSGVAQAIIDALSSIATTTTVPVITYISACIVNLFIPSQGGQWVIQGPIMVPLALEKGAYIPDIVNAFCYGDEATNMLQPLYLIPALAITNTPLKKVWGYCAYIFVFWFVITCIGLLVLPGIF